MKKKYKILGIVTARGGSKGIPGKNIKKLGGKPLIAYTIESAKKSKLITDLILSTDDKKIAKISERYGIDIPFIRPKNLAEDKTSHLPVIQHAIKFMENRTGYQFDYIVIFQPTSPFRTVKDINGTIKMLIDSGADTSVSVCEVETANHPIKVKKMVGNKVLPYCINEVEGVRRQDLPKAYKRSSAVYVMTRDLVIKKNKLFGDKVVGHIVPTSRSIDIDTPLDWLKAKYMLKTLNWS